MRIDDFFGISIPDAGPVFAAAVVVHIAAAFTCIVSGVTASIARKRRGVHPRAGDVYLWALGFVVVTAATMALLRWEHSGYLLGVAVVLAALGTLGWFSRPNRYPRRVTWHAIGMGGSLVVLLIGFYLDNGNEIPVWELLPMTAYVIVPTAVGVPLIWVGLHRYRTGANRRRRGTA